MQFVRSQNISSCCITSQLHSETWIIFCWISVSGNSGLIYDLVHSKCYLSNTCPDIPNIGRGLKLISSHSQPKQTYHRIYCGPISPQLDIKSKMFIHLKIVKMKQNLDFIGPIYAILKETKHDFVLSWFYSNTLCKCPTVKFVIPKFKIQISLL